ncbi:RluA family pseudouridine synthase [Marinobacter salinexigens]|uniref:RluA family pseudouridine synthase n=1 Tax=Marinobacter salinexigens TaxID=2919747 RepID=A0A5B0VKQ0_9GAMM|nr:RluA family pseudouridine synthase [Marinobacter salinexigens]KAA1175024.1 RluA family pseudouridine synthase [Marinobacter salinexigens]
MRKHFDIAPNSPTTAVDALAEASGLPKQRIKDAMAKGACWWTQKGKQVRLRKAKRELKAGTRVQLFYDDQVLARKPESPALLEDKSRYSVWYKPHGLLSQGSQWGDHCSLLRLAEVELNRPCFLIHRLDADAAGLMLIAHDGKAAAALSQCFSGRTMTKVYLARVQGILHADNLLIDAPVEHKEALSRVTTQSTETSSDSGNDTSLVQVQIETGRKHQIRRHLSGIGHPIVGDRLYGQATGGTLQLLAVSLSFDCPVTRKPVSLRLPDHLNSLAD